MISNTMICSPVLIESARGKSCPVCHAFQTGFIYYYILNPPYLNFSLTIARGMKLCTGYLQYNWVRIMQIHFLLRSWINKNRQSWIKTRDALLFFSESKETE